MNQTIIVTDLTKVTVRFGFSHGSVHIEFEHPTQYHRSSVVISSEQAKQIADAVAEMAKEAA